MESMFANDVPPDFDEMRHREDRKERIKPFWDHLVHDREPKVNKDAHLQLAHDLKEEGNALFKEGLYDIAWMHYRNAIFVVRILENRFYHKVEVEFTSSLFSNRAFCCLKKIMFKEAIQDCASAIAVYPKNIKAYYRQAQAYKSMKNYTEAYEAARKGHEIQPSSALKELIDDLEPLVKPGFVRKVAEASLKSAQPYPFSSGPDPADEWLAGTNVVVTQKHLESKKMNKKSKKKSKGGLNPVKLVPEMDLNVESEGSSGSPGPEDDAQFATLYNDVRKEESFKGQSGLGSWSINPPPEDEETSPWSFPHDDDDVETSIKAATPAMGLDNFSPSVGTPAVARQDYGRTSGKSSRRTSRSSQSPVKSAATLTSTSNTMSSTPSPASTPGPQIVFPIADTYDFKMACNRCFVKNGEGVKAFQYISTNHQCARDVLIVKKRDVSGLNWVKIRSRPDLKGHYGTYKVCTQFNQNKPCKVSEEKCTFPHTQVELRLWTLDRDGNFSINNFITDCKTHKIYDNSGLSVSVARPKTQYIPGLNYPEDTPSKPTLENFPSFHTQQPGPTLGLGPTPGLGSTPGLSSTLGLGSNPGLATTPGLGSTPGLGAIPGFASSVGTSPGHSFNGGSNPGPTPGPNVGHTTGPSVGTAPNVRPTQGAKTAIGTPQTAALTRFPPPQMGQPVFTNQPQRPQLPYQPQLFSPGQFSQPPPTFFNQPQFQQQQPPPPNNWTRDIPRAMEEDEPEQPQQPEPESCKKQLENPLSDTHRAVTACQFCFKPSKYPGVYEYQEDLVHKCEETMLAMKSKDGKSPWLRIRERKNHREFPGQYILCNSVKYNNPKFCKYSEEVCSFAHNEVEKRLWTLEKDGKFDVVEYLVQIKKYKEGKGYTLRECQIKHGGYFDFICRNCYYSTPPQISSCAPDGKKCNGKEPHPWKDFKILAHMGQGQKRTPVNPRRFIHKSAFFKICKWLHYCRRIVNATCKFAHSVVERDIWMVERDCNISREDIVTQSKQAFSAAKSAPLKSAVPIQTSWVQATSTESKSNQSPTHTYSVKVTDGLCQVIVMEVCQSCWKNGQKTQQEAGKDRCLKGHGNWSCNIIYLLSPSMKELRPLPNKIPQGLNFLVCKSISEGRKCQYQGSQPCQFAHSNDELEAWKFMCMNNLRTVQELSKVSKEAQKIRAESAKTKISGQSVVSVGPNTAPVRPAMPMPSKHTYYCNYCAVSCNSQKQWDEHCVSDKHTFNVNSDREQHWNFRQPPWTLGKYFELCPQHLNGGKCNYSHVLDMYNLCQYAHSQDELDEWKERYQWRQMKREMARQDRVFSYMDELLEKFESSTDPVKVICEELDGVSLQLMGDLNIYKEDKHASYIWTFNITAQKSLEKVALLYNRDRLHFSLDVGGDRLCQIAEGETFQIDGNQKGQLTYRVGLRFIGGMFGSFQQWILFDFGEEPVLCRKISVEIGDQSSHEKVKTLRQQLHFDHWTSLNREIIKQEQLQENEEKLILKYKEPASSSTAITGTTVSKELNQHNYRGKMHKLLELEEITRCQIISSYNLCVQIECMKAIQDNTYVFASNGELFAKVPLLENLTEDTDAGRLILTSVRKVLLAPQNNSTKVVYESVILREENFNFDGRGRDFIYLCLSAECVRRLQLKPGSKLDVEIQFQMDRLFFCRMHSAVDQLMSEGIVFPDVPKINPLRNEKHNLKVSSSVLNADQMAAVRHIVAERTGYTPPFVLFGPFGTGKTETIAQATMVLLKETQNTRILICAQSNSAADLYILKHLDSYLKKMGNVSQLCRVYHRERRVFTVASEVKKYCRLSPDGDSFKMLTAEDIEKCRVVIVTVTTSLELASLGLQGKFTHIFIDEAAQTLECESLMPLTLATEKTCIVLAGDHQQISPRVYSTEAKNQKFHQSLLERLYNYYDSHSSQINTESPLNILLSINYRSKMEILRFISAVFYGGPEVLQSEANIPSVVDITPLVFHAVQGREVQNEYSVSYHNMSEVQEIVERVADLYQVWPEEWGPKNASEIGIVTPYADQVQLIRKKLREKNVALKQVVVERVQGVQGKEFRAMFISTVRTQFLLENSHSDALTDTETEDFGFLSDPKLLNTALTRSQSMVVVVGDPVALCAIGECSRVWQIYLKQCQNMRSLHPQNFTLDTIKQQVQSLQYQPARQSKVEPHANPLAEKLKQSKAQLAGPWGKKAGSEQASSVDYSQWTTDTDMSANDSVEDPNASFPQFHEPLSDFNRNGLSSLSVVGQPAFNAASSGMGLQASVLGAAKHTNEGPQINVSLARAPLAPIGRLRTGLARMPAPSSTTSVEPCFDIGDVYDLEPDKVISQIFAEQGQVSSSPVAILEENGFAVIKSKSNGLVAPDIMPLYSESQLLKMLQDSMRYKRCKFSTKNGMFYGVSDLNGDMIEIPSQLYCGHARNGDIIVVEMFTDINKAYGKVIAVLQHAVNLENNVILCRVGDTNGVMVPVDESLPPLFNVTTPQYLPQNAEGKINIYKVTTSKQVRFSHFETISPLDVKEKLFAVKFLKYDRKLQYPLGIVVGLISAQADVVSSTRILDLEFCIKKAYNQAVTREIDSEFVDSSVLPAPLFRNRHLDLREFWCFTIDKEGTGHSCRAFSIDEHGDGLYKVGIHISDVASVVRQNSLTDVECRSRGMSAYPIQSQAVHMLPGKLTSGLCSMKQNEDRLALSVIFLVMTTGEISQINVQKSIVNCKKNFTYTEAEAIVHDPLAVEDYLKSCVFVLFEIANLWRQKRLGNAALSTENIVNKATLLSHQLVEEMVIMAEVHVASVLTSKIPQAVPILVQPPPVSQHLEAWKGEHAADAINSIALTKPFLNLAQLEVCNCSLACIHSVNYVRQFNISKRDQVHVISILWDSLNDAVAMGDNGAMMNIIATAENHPQIAVALTKLRNIQEDPKYVICSDVPGEQQLHYELNRKQYVTFTNPLSCYMDIVVQRILLATLDNQPCPYKKQELKAICDHVNVSMGRCRSYEKEYFAVQLGAALLSKPLIVQPFVIGLNPHHVEVCFPMLPCFTDVQKIDLALLGICATPEVTPDGQLILKWQERVYDCDVLRNQAPVGSNIGELNPDRFIYMIPAYHWQRLLIAIRELDPSMRLEKLRSAVSLVGKQVSNPAHAENNQYIDDVTCEGSKLGNPLHFAEFSLRLHASQVLLMQLSARLNNSILTPYIQLVSLTNTLDICLQHRENPLECFITLDSSISAPLKPCPDINTYQKLWSAVAEIEAVTRAVEHNETVTIDNVLLDWKQQASNYVADLILPSTFLKQRGIKITSSVQELMLFSPKNSTYCSAYFSDFMCVRYSNIDFPDKSGLCDELSRIVNNRCSVTWVGHCKVVGVISINEKIVFKLQLVQSDVPLPLQLLHRRSCSVEIIHRTNQDRLILYALKNLDNCSQLAKDIILRQAPSAPVETSDVTLLLQSCKQVFPGTNGQQDEAMKHALSQPLTMIQGCVGSGKSLLAAILGLAYCKRNQTCRQQAQVLVCAPTEASVDVIYDFFQSLGGSNANIVRVYGNAVEQVLHPGPKLSRRPCPSWDKENILKMRGRYAQRSLYSLVRQDGTRYGSKINEYESLFSLYPEDISVEDNDSYMQIVGRAEAAVLSEADIILCTCITSGQPELAACINIHQIVIDDANSGSELEILVPLSVYKDTENVALLGDINQMGPSVGSKIAQELGLGVSIKQSYMSTAVYLNVHYRVHEGIMDFPVKYGYTRATCGIISQRQPSVLNWTGGRNKPSAFCKLDGLEASIPLKYSCPLGETIVNMEQANFAVRVAMALVSSYNVNGSNICIISSTQAQCRNIERLLSVSATKSKIQCMGIKEVQGLEFDYVILSTVRSIPAIRVERYCTRKWLQENLGLLTNQGLVMSALTRARKGLVIVGNENLLCCSPMWRQLVGEYQQSNRLVAAEVFLQTMSL